MWGALRRIPLWENRRRQQVLASFRANVKKYFGEADYDSTHDNYVDNEDSAATRQALNESIFDVDRIIQYAGVDAVVQWSPPPMVGGAAQRIPVIVNVFHLHRYQIDEQQIVSDFVDRAIGEYRRDEGAARVRTYNPFFWLGLGLEYFASLPFRFLRRAGFNTTNVEQSWIGRSIKLSLKLIGLVGSLVTILQAIGKLQPILQMFGLS